MSKNVLPIVAGTTDKPKHFAIWLRYIPDSLIRIAFETALTWKSTSAMSRDTSETTKRLMTYLFFSTDHDYSTDHSKSFVLPKVEDFIFDLIILVVIVAQVEMTFEANAKSGEDIFRFLVQAPSPYSSNQNILAPSTFKHHRADLILSFENSFVYTPTDLRTNLLSLDQGSPWLI